jgi:hypothetical protein
MACGAKKYYTGGPAPLVCSLDDGHDLPHAMADPKTGLIYARWPVVFDDSAERAVAARRAIAEAVAKKKRAKRGKGA